MREVFKLSKAEAGRLGHDHIGPETYLLAIIRKGDGIAIETLDNLGVELGELRQMIEEKVEIGNGPTVGLFSPNADAKRVLQAAKQASNSMGHGWVGVEHLLIALQGEETTIASKCLRKIGVESESLKNEVVRVIEGGPSRAKQMRIEQKALLERLAQSNPAPLISVCFDESEFTEEDIEIFLSYLAETYRSAGGVGLKVVKGYTLSPEDAEVYA